MNTPEQQFYEMAAEEVVKRTVVKGLFAEAFSECDGDRQKSIARYITLRVRQLREDYNRDVRELARELESRICPDCIFFGYGQNAGLGKFPDPTACRRVSCPKLSGR